MKNLSVEGLTPEQIAELQANIENFKKQNEPDVDQKKIYNLVKPLTKRERRIISFLDKFTKGNWIVNETTGLVDIEGDFICLREDDDDPIEDFKGVKFGVVTGHFYFEDQCLESLEGAPQKVGGNFVCSYNGFTSLEGAPQWVGGNFECSNNGLDLTSLEGAPQWVGGNFECVESNLKSLEGAPQWVGGDFNCGDNELTSLEGAPQKVGGDFYCYNNKLTSLEGAPLHIEGSLYNTKRTISY